MAPAQFEVIEKDSDDMMPLYLYIDPKYLTKKFFVTFSCLLRYTITTPQKGTLGYKQ